MTRLISVQICEWMSACLEGRLFCVMGHIYSLGGTHPHVTWVTWMSTARLKQRFFFVVWFLLVLLLFFRLSFCSFPLYYGASAFFGFCCIILSLLLLLFLYIFFFVFWCKHFFVFLLFFFVLRCKRLYFRQAVILSHPAGISAAATPK